MRRLPLLDAALLATLVPLWAAAFTLHVAQIAHHRLAWVGVVVSSGATADDVPVARALWPADDAARWEVAPGDRLIAVGDADLRGVGPLGFFARAHEARAEALRASADDPSVWVKAERAGAPRTARLPFVPVLVPWHTVPFTVALAATGTLVLLRRPGAPIGRAFFLTALVLSLHWTWFFGGRREITYAWAAVFAASSLLTLPIMVRTAAMFPEDVPPLPGVRWWAWCFTALAPFATSAVFGVPFPPAVGLRGMFVVNILFLVTLLAILTRNYRRAPPIFRRQLKWAIYGVYVGALPVLATDVLTAIVPSWWWLHDVAVISLALIPICILIAITRFNLYDIDRLITVTAVYSVISVLALASLLTVAPALASTATERLGVDVGAGRAVLSVLLAALIVPAYRSLQPFIERLMFADRYALQQGVDRLLHQLSACASADELLIVAGTRLTELVRPSSCVIYAPAADIPLESVSHDAVQSLGAAPRGPMTYAPVLVCGGPQVASKPPDLRADGAVIRTLQGRRRPLHLERARSAGALERGSALEQVAAAVLLPINRGDALAAAIALGSKRSGDVYTPTDVALLTAVAEKLSAELLRFEEAEVLRRERAMQEALRQYVPGPVADVISTGQALEGGERDVSVLFVDIRGFTTLSESKQAGQVFSIVSRYTESASGVIREHGGTVLEFLGDGLMAVFGAPQELREHAQAAVLAGCGILAAVGALSDDTSTPRTPSAGAIAAGADESHRSPPGSDDSPIRVGVGIATGPAFVGNVLTADRVIYTALGDTVNLASRLQALTRELGAAIAIDRRTYAEASTAARSFESRGATTIRGRQQTVDVHVLPLEG